MTDCIFLMIKTKLDKISKKVRNEANNVFLKHGQNFPDEPFECFLKNEDPEKCILYDIGYDYYCAPPMNGTIKCMVCDESIDDVEDAIYPFHFTIADQILSQICSTLDDLVSVLPVSVSVELFVGEDIGNLDEFKTVECKTKEMKEILLEDIKKSGGTLDYYRFVIKRSICTTTLTG